MQRLLRDYRFTLLKAAAFALVLAAFYLPSAHQHYQHSFKLHNGDAFMHLPPYLRELTDAPHDYPERYIRDCHPIGYRTLYSLAQAMNGVPTLSRWLPYILTALFALLIALAVYPLGGWTMALLSAMLALSADVFISRAVGGLPRAFGFTCLAACLASITHRRPFALAACTVISTLFYPTAAVIGGASLAAGILIPQLRMFPTLTDYTWKRRVGMVSATALLCLASLLPSLLASRQYGGNVGPGDIKAYPEAGRRGRCNPADRVDYSASLPVVFRSHLPLTIAKEEGPAFLPALNTHVRPHYEDNGVYIPLCVLSALGLVWLAVSVPGGCGVAVYLGVALACYMIAQWLSPLLFLPERYVSYPIPLLGLVLLPAGCAAIGYGLLPKHRRHAATATCAIGGAVLLSLFGGGIHPKVGYARGFRHMPVYDFLQTLPAAVISGSPNWLAPVPFLCHQPVLVSQETHIPYHRGYLDEMRDRMRAQIEALYSPDPAALHHLRDQYGVTHMVIPHSLMQGIPPIYFMPFTAWYGDAAEKMATNPPALHALAAEHTAYTDKHVSVIDLAQLTTRLEATAGAPATAAHAAAVTGLEGPPAGKPEYP